MGRVSSYAFIIAAGLSVGHAFASERTENVSLDRLVQTAAQNGSERQPMQNGRLAMAALPSYRPRALKSTMDDSGFDQRIELDRSASGLQSNMIDIRYRKNMDGLSTSALQKPTEAGIRDELAARFPKMQMIVVDHPRNNSYGIYGLAVGKWANGTSCIYAWQWADSGDTRTASEALNSLSLRVSVCRAKTALDDLVKEFDGLRLGPTRFEPAPGGRGAQKAKLAERQPVGQHLQPRQMFAARVRSRVPVAQSDVQPPSVSDQSKFAASEPALDPNLPAAAYRGPSSNAQIGQTITSGGCNDPNSCRR